MHVMTVIPERVASAATTRLSVPNGVGGTVLAARPGELVQVDTTPLDVLAVLDDGVVARVELTILVDLATRTICSGLLRPHGTKAVDASLLLARALVPEAMRPGWPGVAATRPTSSPSPRPPGTPPYQGTSTPSRPDLSPTRSRSWTRASARPHHAGGQPDDEMHLPADGWSPPGDTISSGRHRPDRVPWS